MILPQSLFYQKPDLADRVSVLPSSTSYVKAFFTKTSHYLFSRKDAKDMQVTSYLFLSRNAAKTQLVLTLLLSYSLTLLHLSRCLTRADANYSVQWAKTNQARKDKNASED